VVRVTLERNGRPIVASDSRAPGVRRMVAWTGKEMRWR
jgi:hypothetical protein